MDLKEYVASVENFPKEGILFRDITPLLANGEAYKSAIKEIAEFVKSVGGEAVYGPESRGFVIGCPVATELGIGFVPVRKPGKLPRKTVSIEYALEYGTNKLEITADSIVKGQKVVIIDDLLATGGTIDATCKLIEENGGIVAGIAVLIELEDLKGRELLKDYNVFSLMKY